MANAQKTQPNDKTAGTSGDAAQNSINNKTGNTGTSNQPAGGSQLSEQVGNIVSGDTGAVKDVLKQAKESTGQVANQAYGIAAQKASSAIDEQKTNLAQGLTGIADSIRQLGTTSKDARQQNVITDVTAKYSDSIASQVEQLSRYLDGKDLREMAEDVEKFARRNPAVFLGGAFALGLLAARFLKSGNSSQALMRRERYQRKGVYLPDEHQGIHLPENLDSQSQKSSGSQSNFSTKTSSTGTTGALGAKDFTSGISGVKDSSSDISGAKNTKIGTSGTTNTTTGSSNQGG